MSDGWPICVPFDDWGVDISDVDYGWMTENCSVDGLNWCKQIFDGCTIPHPAEKASHRRWCGAEDKTEQKCTVGFHVPNYHWLMKANDLNDICKKNLIINYERWIYLLFLLNILYKRLISAALSPNQFVFRWRFQIVKNHRLSSPAVRVIHREFQVWSSWFGPVIGLLPIEDEVVRLTIGFPNCVHLI